MAKRWHEMTDNELCAPASECKPVAETAEGPHTHREWSVYSGENDAVTFNGKYMNAAIRCDDDRHVTIIESNAIQRTRGFGEGIISKGDNDILNNELDWVGFISKGKQEAVFYIDNIGIRPIADN